MQVIILPIIIFGLSVVLAILLLPAEWVPAGVALGAALASYIFAKNAPSRLLFGDKHVQKTCGYFASIILMLISFLHAFFLFFL